MGDGTNYVIEQLGLALKGAEENYQKLLQHAQGLQTRVNDMEAEQETVKVDTSKE